MVFLPVQMKKIPIAIPNPISIFNHVILKSFNHGSEIDGNRLYAQRHTIISCHALGTVQPKCEKQE